MTLPVVQWFGCIDSLVLAEKINHFILVTYAFIIMDKPYFVEYLPRICGLHEVWVSPELCKGAQKFQIYDNF